MAGAHGTVAPHPQSGAFGKKVVIQSVLFFSLGFLCAFLLALMVAPAIWRRAVALTRKRLEASMPMSPDVIRADKDQIRAEFAMMARKLELEAQTAREKAAEARADLGRKREEIKQLTADRVERDARIIELEAVRSGLEEELSARDGSLATLRGHLDDALAKLESLSADYENLGARHNIETETASNLKTELVERQAQIEKLSADVSALRVERKEADRWVREVLADNKAGQEALRNERKRVADLEKRVERLLTDLTDREERLERREKELSRLKGDQKFVAAKAREGSTLDDGRQNGLEAPASHRHENDVLREQLTELAAEIVHLTALVDTPDSPIRKALDAEVSSADGKSSLAERIRALRKAATFPLQGS